MGLIRKILRLPFNVDKDRWEFQDKDVAIVGTGAGGDSPALLFKHQTAPKPYQMFHENSTNGLWIAVDNGFPANAHLLLTHFQGGRTFDFILDGDIHVLDNRKIFYGDVFNPEFQGSYNQPLDRFIYEFLNGTAGYEVKAKEIFLTADGETIPIKGQEYIKTFGFGEVQTVDSTVDINFFFLHPDVINSLFRGYCPIPRSKIFDAVCHITKVELRVHTNINAAHIDRVRWQLSDMTASPANTTVVDLTTAGIGQGNVLTQWHDIFIGDHTVVEAPYRFMFNTLGQVTNTDVRIYACRITYHYE